MIDGDALFAEYIDLDYSVALTLHLYHYAVRDMIRWAIANGYKWFRSSALNYDPKLHLRHVLDPIDLYVPHISGILNAALKVTLSVMEPTRYDKTLRRFSNYNELWEETSYGKRSEKEAHAHSQLRERRSPIPRHKEELPVKSVKSSHSLID